MARRLVALLRRLGGVVFSVVLTFLGLTAVTFVIGRFMPIDPVISIVGDKASTEVYDRVYKELGLDQPVVVQYATYLAKVVRGEFGNSVMTARPVIEDVWRVFPATMELATLALIIGVVVGVPMGVVAATNRGRWVDQIVRFMSLLGYSMPVFWLGLVGLLLFYAKLGWVEGPGRLNVAFDDLVPTITGLITIDAILAGEDEVFFNAIGHLILPASILGYLSLAYIARMTRSFMLAQLEQEYILAALVLPGRAGQGTLFQLDASNVVLETVKPAEDGSGDIILRLYEAMRTATRCTLKTHLPLRQAWVCDMMETAGPALAAAKDGLTLDFRPFEIKTVRIRTH